MVDFPETISAWLELYRQDRPRAQSDLWGLIRQEFGLRLPHKAYTPGHGTPFGFVSDAFFHPDWDLATWANRSGLKTLSSSIIAALEYRYYEVPLAGRVLAGSEAQAHNLYEYWVNWCGRILRGLVRGQPQKSQTYVSGGKFEVLTASPKQVRGPKVARLFCDEIDEIDPPIYDAATGMLDSRHGIVARRVDTSTWHRPAGPMGKLVAEADKRGIRLYTWNLWETIEQCPEERHDQGRNCEACPLGEKCLAKARETDPRAKVGIASICDGMLHLSDAIKQIRHWGQRQFDAEALCKRPSAEGLVYPEFDRVRHRRETAPADLKIYRVIDWGYDVFVCLWIGEDKDGTSYILDTYRAKREGLKVHADFINSHRLQKIAATYCDPAGKSKSDQTGKSNIEQMKEWGIECQYTTASRLRNVANGIQMVRGLLAPASGSPRLYYIASPNNDTFRTAMESYHNRQVNGIWIDEPKDPQEYEHVPDGLRYYTVNRQRPEGITVVRLGAS